MLTEADVTALTDALRTHASESGRFESVSGHAVLSAHGTGLAWWCYVENIRPYAAGSGLNTTSIVLTYRTMITMNTATYQPLDAVDPRVSGAASEMLRAYAGDFTLGGRVRNVDIYGAAGRPLVAEAGWLTLAGDGGGRYRSMITTLPLVINNTYDQAE